MPSLSNISSWSSSAVVQSTVNIRNLDVDSLDANAIATASLTLTGTCNFQDITTTGISSGTATFTGDISGVKYMSNSTSDGYVLTSADYITQRMKMYHNGTSGYLKTFNGNLLLLGQNVQGLTLSNTSVQADLPFVATGNITQSGGSTVLKATTVESFSTTGNITQTGGSSTLKATTVDSLTTAGSITQTGGSVTLKNVTADSFTTAGSSYSRQFYPTNFGGDANVTLFIAGNANVMYIDTLSAAGATAGGSIAFRTSPMATGSRLTALLLGTDQSATFYGNMNQSTGSTATLKATTVSSLTTSGNISQSAGTTSLQNTTITNLTVTGSYSIPGLSFYTVGPTSLSSNSVELSLSTTPLEYIQVIVTSVSTDNTTTPRLAFGTSSNYNTSDFVYYGTYNITGTGTAIGYMGNTTGSQGIPIGNPAGVTAGMTASVYVELKKMNSWWAITGWTTYQAASYYHVDYHGVFYPSGFPVNSVKLYIPTGGGNFDTTPTPAANLGSYIYCSYK